MTKVHEDWFQAKDSRGTRNYRFNRVISSGIDLGQSGVPVPEPYAQIMFLHGVFGQGAFISFGLAGPDEAVISNEKKGPSRKR